MLFNFQKYIQPIWYFNLSPKGGRKWIEPSFHSNDQKKSSFNNNYSIWWSYFDGAGIENEEGFVNLSENCDIIDNYRFIRRNFHPFWAIYVYVIRVLSFHNPFVEFISFLKSIKTKRYYIKFKSLNLNFKDAEIQFGSKVSIIIPTLNRYRYLKDVLFDLQLQTYKNFEVIIVDQSDPFKHEFYNQFDLDLHLVRQEEKLLWRARNTAIRKAKGDVILLFDDDSRVKEDWIINHIRCLAKFNCQISSGISTSKVGDRIPENYSSYRLSDQLDTGNVMIKREVFEHIGLFDEQFEKQRMGDAEFGLRAYLEGFKNISNPLAKRVHLKVDQGGLRQMGHWDAFRPRKLLAPRPVPSVLYYTRKYFGDKLSKYWILKSVPPSLVPFKWKRNRILFALSFPLILIVSPIIIIQVMWSWQLSSNMLNEGSKIPRFEKVTVDQF